jgi:hypothetical protein
MVFDRLMKHLNEEVFGSAEIMTVDEEDDELNEDIDDGDDTDGE